MLATIIIVFGKEFHFNRLMQKLFYDNFEFEFVNTNSTV